MTRIRTADEFRAIDDYSAEDALVQWEVSGSLPTVEEVTCARIGAVAIALIVIAREMERKP